MGRSKKTGFDYFPLDIDIMQDIRMRKLIKRKGGGAVTVYTFLLCNIYKGGYWLQWDEDIPFILSEQTSFEEEYIQSVIDSCLELGLFSKELFDSEKVLTSESIQRRYKQMADSSGRTKYTDIHEIMPEYLLIELNESSKKTTKKEEDFGEKEDFLLKNQEKKGISSEKKPITSGKMQQSKINNILTSNIFINPPHPLTEGEAELSKPKQKRNKSSTLNGKARNLFEDYYLKTFNTPYYWSGKDAGAMKGLLQKLSFTMQEGTSEDELLEELSIFLSAVKEGWIFENMSVTNLNSKFNEIRAKCNHLDAVPWEWDVVVKKFNGLGILQVTVLDDDRKRMFISAMNNYGKDAIAEVYSKIKQSGHLRGYNKDRWIADFDFVFNKSHFRRILDGVYDDKNLKIGD